MTGNTRAIGIATLRPVVRVCAVIACLALVWSVVQLEPWQRTAESRSAPLDDRPWTAVNPLGVNTFLAREVEDWKRDNTLEMAAEMGAGWIKEQFAWREIEPEDDVYWDAKYQQSAWAKYDAIVEAAGKYGLRIIARIDQTPAWARPVGSIPTTPPTDPEKFGEFVADFVRHFQSRVQFIQIWNEPNLAAEWGGRIDPQGYAELLRVAAEHARAVDPNVVVLSAPMAMTTENSGRAMSDLDYWQALYDANIGPWIDIVSATAYGLDNRYDAPPDPARLNLRRVELLHGLLVRNGDGSKPIWLNEYGWNAAPGDFPPDRLTWSRVSERQQADWTAGGIEYARQEWSWFGVASIWYFRQVGDISLDSALFYFRMVDVEFTPRDVYRSVSEIGHDLMVAEPGSYNDLEAPLRAMGEWTVTRDATSSGAEYLSGAPGSRLSITFEGSALRLQLIPSQDETRLRVTIHRSPLLGATGPGSDARTVTVPPGAASVDIYDEAETSAPVARTAVIENAGQAALGVDGFVVDSHRSLRNVALAAASLVALVAADFGLGRKSGG